MRKGDRVVFTIKNILTYGVVSRGGKGKITVIIDGGIKQISGHISLFKLSDVPLPKDDSSPMDKWSIKSYRNTGAGDETPQFTAKILLNGKPVINASNYGHGGSNDYHGNRAVIDSFEDDATAWAEQFGYKNPTEADDLWLGWAAEEKPYGVLAVDYLKSFVDMVENSKKPFVLV